MKKFTDNIQIVELNVTELCTRKCWFCPRGDSNVYKNSNKHMSIETLNNVYNALKTSDYNGYVHFAGFSEPFLYKYIIEALELFAKSYKTNIITNGDCFNESILKALDKIDIHNIKIDLYDNDAQYDKLIELLERSEYQSNNLTINKVYSNTSLEFYNRAGTASFESAAGVDPSRMCTVPFYKIFIDWTGNYLLCMSDWHREAKISRSGMNVRDINLENYLRSDLYKEFARNMIHTQRKNLTPCFKCDINGTKFGKIWDPNET